MKHFLAFITLLIISITIFTGFVSNTSSAIDQIDTELTYIDATPSQTEKIYIIACDSVLQPLKFPDTAFMLSEYPDSHLRTSAMPAGCGIYKLNSINFIGPVPLKELLLIDDAFSLCYLNDQTFLEISLEQFQDGFYLAERKYSPLTNNISTKLIKKSLMQYEGPDDLQHLHDLACKYNQLHAALNQSNPV